MKMLPTLMLIAGLAGAALLSAACANKPVVYTDNPYATDPGIRTIAVAPFLMNSAVAAKLSQPFESMAFQTTDGAVAYFSKDFAESFANGLTNFPGVTVIGPERVLRAWMDGANKGEADSNPLANRDAALKIARRLGADAILSAEVVEWDPFVPRITLDWSLNYTRNRTASATDVRMLEQAGKGGFLESRSLGSGGTVFTQQLTLDGESGKANDLLKIYEHSLEGTENEGYETPRQGILQRPYPRYVRFAAWAAVYRAFEYERARSSSGDSK